MKIGDLIVDSFFQISIHWLGLSKPDCPYMVYATHSMTIGLTNHHIGPHRTTSGETGSHRATLDHFIMWHRKTCSTCTLLLHLRHGHPHVDDQAMCRAYSGFNVKSPRPQMARSASWYWLMTMLQQQRARTACFTVPQNAVAGTSTSVSTDRDLTVNYNPGAGKKINQRKWSRTQRTVTVIAKRYHFWTLASLIRTFVAYGFVESFGFPFRCFYAYFLII